MYEHISIYHKAEGKAAGHDLVGLERDGTGRDIATSRGRPSRRSQCFGRWGLLHDNHEGDTHEQPLYEMRDDMPSNDAALVEYTPAPG